MQRIAEETIGSVVELADGSRLVVRDIARGEVPQMDDEIYRNVYRLDRNGDVIWQVQPQPTGPAPSDFSFMRREGSLILVWTSRGYIYEVDPDSGALRYFDFAK